jgi:hypothetical protein
MRYPRMSRREPAGARRGSLPPGFLKQCYVVKQTQLRATEAQTNHLDRPRGVSSHKREGWTSARTSPNYPTVRDTVRTYLALPLCYSPSTQVLLSSYASRHYR